MTLRLPAPIANLIANVPPKLLVPAAALVALALIGGGVVAMSGGDDPAPRQPSNAILRDVTPTRVVATSIPTSVPAGPTPTPAPNRANCGTIRGTAYLSDEERDWFTTNCAGTQAGQAGAIPSGPAAPVTGPAAAPSAGQAPIGARLVIPAAGVNADVWRASVPSSGAMPDPVGYFNAVWYDFTALPGYGGSNTGSGNMVMSGHVDCGRCYNGGAGVAVFWHIRELRPGDTAQYVTPGGQTINYVVTRSQALSSSADFDAIVAANAADMTLITCTGTFSGGEYNLRHVVAFRKV